MAESQRGEKKEYLTEKKKFRYETHMKLECVSMMMTFIMFMFTRIYLQAIWQGSK